jgi:hypothetical protein
MEVKTMNYPKRQNRLFTGKYTWLVLLGFLVSFAFVSCKTQPVTPDSLTDTSDTTETTDTTDTTENLDGTADAESVRAFEDARARAEAARNRARMVDAASYYPEEWDSAESRYGEADKAGDPATRTEARSRADEWGQIAIVYDGLFEKTLSRFAEDKARQLVEAREAAREAGARDILPGRFDAADELALSAQSKYDEGDYSGALADGTAAYNRYEALKTIADAYALKTEADAHEFFSYDPENYDAGLDAGNTAVDFLLEGSLADANASAAEALNRFTLVLENGWVGYTNERSVAAQSWRQSALEEKANVAVRNEYQNADNAYNQAHVALRAGKFQEAADLFEKSGILFKQSRDAAVEKRVKAEEAIRQAEQKVSESEVKAKNAQELVGDEE